MALRQPSCCWCPDSQLPWKTHAASAPGAAACARRILSRISRREPPTHAAWELSALGRYGKISIPTLLGHSGSRPNGRCWPRAACPLWSAREADAAIAIGRPSDRCRPNSAKGRPSGRFRNRTSSATRSRRLSAHAGHPPCWASLPFSSSSRNHRYFSNRSAKSRGNPHSCTCTSHRGSAESDNR